MRFLTLVFLSLALVTFASATTRITSFRSLMDGLKTGANVKVVIDYALCDLMVDGK